jgi:hypothetical protein
LELSDHFSARQALDPEIWLRWATAKGYAIPPALSDLVAPTEGHASSPTEGTQLFAGNITYTDAEYDEQLRQVTSAKSEAAASESNSSGDTKRIATLQKLVLAMAKEKYGWSLSNERNPATGTKSGSIYFDVIKHLGQGRGMDPDTIRLALQQAEKEFPGKDDTI